MQRLFEILRLTMAVCVIIGWGISIAVFLIPSAMELVNIKRKGS